MRVEDWLGKDNKLGLDIWSKKYKYNDESFDEWLDRVSGGDKDVKSLILNKQFLFGGRILANRGLDKHGVKTTLSNCYVIAPPEDSIESIFECASKLARTYSYGGGCGIDLSKLAPRGARVNNTAKETSGSVSFMDLYSLVTGLIGQNGRRGALMLSLSCEHPDLEEFISVKSDLNKVTKANISIRITDKFMEAVRDRKPFEMKFTRDETGETLTKTVDAYSLFHKICEMNWDYAEPGALFWDRIENWNLLSCDDNFHYAGTNPCLVGDTKITTTEGEIPIKDLVGEKPYVYCMDKNGELVIRQATRVWKTRENAELVKIKHLRGELICTPDHEIYTTNRGWIKAKDLLPKDRLNGLGRHMANEKYVNVKLTSDDKYQKEHRLIASYFEDIRNKDVHHIDGNTLNNKWSNLEVLEHAKHSIVTNLGHEEYCPRCEKTGKFIPKEYSKKRDALSCNVEMLGKNFIVTSVETLKYVEDVYDMTVPDVHNFVANGVVVHNCAEEPLPAGGSCLLGSINLSAFVKHNKEFDFECFANTVKVAVKALNDVLDEGLELHPLAEQRNSVRDWRQIGLGIMGLADMLIKMGIKYGSKKSIDICDKIGMTLAESALEMSSALAEHFGSYPKFDYTSVVNSDFFALHSDKLDKKFMNHGIRNSQLLTIAPTGTLSTMLGISGGIEPIYANSYTRKTESLHGHDEYYKVYTPIVKEYMDVHAITKEEDLPDFFVTAQTLDYRNRVDMQSIWQKHIDASISSTVNLPKETTVEEVEDLYMYAWEKGLKGITIFRDGCARTGILTTEKPTAEEKPTEVFSLDSTKPITRDDLGSVLNGHTYVKSVACGKLYITINRDENDNLVEVFIDSGKSGGCSANAECLGRYASAAMRNGMSIDSIVDITKGVKCSACTQVKGSKMKDIDGLSCGDVLARTIKQEYDMYHTNNAESYVKDVTPSVPCPECGEKLVFEGGCRTCKNCGWSKCD